MSFITPEIIAVIGIAGFLLIVFQVLLGYRKIKLPPRVHMKVHRRVAWAIVGVSVVHGGMGLYWVGRLVFG